MMKKDLCLRDHYVGLFIAHLNSLRLYGCSLFQHAIYSETITTTSEASLHVGGPILCKILFGECEAGERHLPLRLV